jgi:hypothetical protein
MKRALVFSISAMAALMGGTTALPSKTLAAPEPALSRSQTQKLAGRLIAASKDPAGWGKDVWEALEHNDISPSRSNVCAVLAVIEQESTYTANPRVRGLGEMAEGEIKAKLGRIPVLSGLAAQSVEWFLDNRPTPEKSYLKLIRAAKTERDLDLVYRNMAFYLFREYATTGLLNSSSVARRVDAINPISTIGSMQVSVSFAIDEVEKAKGERLQMNAIWKLRDELYARSGGVNYGTRMLLGYYAGYASRIYVFADFNAGRYASRNAAFQKMVAELSGKNLALDGDLLIYKGGEPAAKESGTESAVRHLPLGLDKREIRRDLLKGKELEFRDTETYKRVAARFTKESGKAPLYAVLPQIRLESPKLSHTMTTEKFARAVMARYEKCMKLR